MDILRVNQRIAPVLAAIPLAVALFVFSYGSISADEVCSSHQGVDCSVQTSTGYAVCRDGFLSSTLYEDVAMCQTAFSCYYPPPPTCTAEKLEELIDARDSVEESSRYNTRRDVFSAEIYACQKLIKDHDTAVSSYHVCIKNENRKAEIEKGEQYCDSLEKEGEIRRWNAINKRCDLSCKYKYREADDTCIPSKFASDSDFDSESELDALADSVPVPVATDPFSKALQSSMSSAPKDAESVALSGKEIESEQTPISTIIEEPRPAQRVWWWFLNPFSWFK